MKAPVVALKQPGITARTPDQFARKSVHNGRNPANTITSHSPKVTADQGLGSSSRKTYASASDSWLSSMFNAKQPPRRSQRLRRSLACLGNVLNFIFGV